MQDRPAALGGPCQAPHRSRGPLAVNTMKKTLGSSNGKASDRTHVYRQGGQNKGNFSRAYPGTEMYLIASTRREGKKRRKNRAKESSRQERKEVVPEGSALRKTDGS